MARTLSLPFSALRFRRARERAGLTQEDLAQRTKETGRAVKRSTITHIENGDYGPSAPVLKALVDALGIAVDEVLDENTDTEGDDGE